MFEKRARHKTREDRYEPKAKKSKQDKGQEKDTKRTTSRRLKKRDKNKPKKDGAELMRNFSSKSIGQDRLTFRPSYGLGLFNNGRSSDPTTSGVPDLAFSEMDSLQQNEKRRHTTEKELAIAKSRQKEKRKTSKPVEDISAFFNQFRKPLHEINVENGQKRSRHIKSFATQEKSICVHQCVAPALFELRKLVRNEILTKSV
ncbi:hypothetical protein M7I_1357 [Glarea lozoyensis 74030]|uniref:Uncharacterized protein n=1 Tax=Glarea lozoyensis (strain ATCC 74030 / MF5533) TaxID=1104152 RepID=H0EFU9_GLAL7|nr:hypothetical protein M7I_1357 [Glarea lozoyensis 74030]